MKTEQEIKEMLEAKRKQVKSKLRPDIVKQMDAVTISVLEWVLEEQAND